MGLFGDTNLKKMKKELYEGGMAVAVSYALPAQNVSFMIENVRSGLLDAAQRMVAEGRRNEVEQLVESARSNGGGSNPVGNDEAEALWNSILDDLLEAIRS